MPRLLKNLFLSTAALALLMGGMPVFALSDAEINAKVNQILPPASVTADDAGVGARQSLPTGNLKTAIVPSAIKILLALTGSVSFIVFVYAGVMLIIAQGNEEQITKFKNTLIWSLVGLVFVTTAYAIVRGVMQLSFT